MVRPRQLNDPVRTTIVLERDKLEALQLRVGNISEWIRDKIEGELTLTNITEMELELLKIEQKKKEADILKENAEKEAAALQSRLISMRAPSNILENAQKTQLSKAVKAIKEVQKDPIMAVRKAEAWVEVLKNIGVNITPRELLHKAEFEQSEMYR